MGRINRWQIRALGTIGQITGILDLGEGVTQFKAELRLHKGESVRVIIIPYDPNREKEELRSVQQNKYYHKCLDLICEHTGENHLKLHEDLKVELLGRPYVYKDKEVIVVPSTTELTTKTFGDYLEKVFNHAATMGIVLPDSKQYYDKPLA